MGLSGMNKYIQENLCNLMGLLGCFGHCYDIQNDLLSFSKFQPKITISFSKSVIEELMTYCQKLVSFSEKHRSFDARSFSGKRRVFDEGKNFKQLSLLIFLKSS